MKSVTFQAILAPGYSVGEALDFIEQQMAEISLKPYTISVVNHGNSKNPVTA